MGNALLTLSALGGRDSNRRVARVRLRELTLALPRLAASFGSAHSRSSACLTCFPSRSDARTKSTTLSLQMNVSGTPARRCFWIACWSHQGEDNLPACIFRSSRYRRTGLLQVADARGDAVAPSLSRALLHRVKESCQLLLASRRSTIGFCPCRQADHQRPRLPRYPCPWRNIARRYAFVRHHLLQRSAEGPSRGSSLRRGLPRSARRESHLPRSCAFGVFRRYENAIGRRGRLQRTALAARTPRLFCCRRPSAIERHTLGLMMPRSFAQREAWFTAIRGFSHARSCWKILGLPSS